MKALRKIVLVLIVGVLVSCSKEKLELPESNDPVFVINGTIGGTDFDLIAGDEGAYMFTTTQSINGVNFYSGMISDGNLSIELGIYDGMLDMPNHQPEIELSNLTPVFSVDPNQPLTILSKSMFSNASYIDNIIWSIDGSVAGINDVEIEEAGHYDVCAQVTYADLTVETLCNDLIVGYNHSANFSIDFTSSGGYLNAGLSNVTGGASVTNVDWYINDVWTETNPTTAAQLVTGTHKVTAVAHFSNGAVRTKNILVNGFQQNKGMEDFTMFEDQSSANVIQDFNCRLRVTMNGQEYDSEIAENLESSVDILNIEYYGPNNSGNSVYKVEANVNAKVRSLTTLKQIPISFTTVFGIEIP